MKKPMMPQKKKAAPPKGMRSAPAMPAKQYRAGMPMKGC